MLRPERLQNTAQKTQKSSPDISVILEYFEDKPAAKPAGIRLIQPLSLILRCPVLKDLHICPNLRKTVCKDRNICPGCDFPDFSQSVSDSCVEVSLGFFTMWPVFSGLFPGNILLLLNTKRNAFVVRWETRDLKRTKGDVSKNKGHRCLPWQISSAWFPLKRSQSPEFFLRMLILYWGAAWPIINADRRNSCIPSWVHHL